MCQAFASSDLAQTSIPNPVLVPRQDPQGISFPSGAVITEPFFCTKIGLAEIRTPKAFHSCLGQLLWSPFFFCTKIGLPEISFKGPSSDLWSDRMKLALFPEVLCVFEGQENVFPFLSQAFSIPVSMPPLTLFHTAVSQRVSSGMSKSEGALEATRSVSLANEKEMQAQRSQQVLGSPWWFHGRTDLVQGGLHLIFSALMIQEANSQLGNAHRWAWEESQVCRPRARVAWLALAPVLCLPSLPCCVYRRASRSLSSHP